jgi:exonuclease VII small subunit
MGKRCNIFRGYVQVAQQVVKILDNISILLKESFTSLHRGEYLILDCEPLLKMFV